jgi:hypothetical protein
MTRTPRRRAFGIDAALALALPLTALPAVAQAAWPHFQNIVVDSSTGSERYNEKALADVNGDGLVDVIAQNGSSGVFWYRCPDWTAFQVSTWRYHGEEALAVDVDGDGDPDLVASGRSDREPVWYENPRSEGADLTNTLWTVHQLGSFDPRASHDLEVADVDQNGRIDVIMMGGILFQTGDNVWSFSSAAAVLPGRGPSGTGSGDIDGDGDVDIVAPDGEGLVLWWENPLPTGNPKTTAWTSRIIGPAWDDTSSQLGDLNDDGRTDVVVAPYAGSGGLYWFIGPTNPKAPGAVWVDLLIDPTISDVHEGSMHIHDFDLDGTPDLLVTEQEQSDGDAVAIYYNDGSGSFTKNLLASTGGFNTKVADLEGDGDFDLLNAPSGYYGVANPLTVMRNMPEPPMAAGLVVGATALLAASRKRKGADSRRGAARG